MTILKGGHAITDIDDWAEFAGPKSIVQWKDNRSAKESARAWLSVKSPALPTEVAAVLSSHTDFGEVRAWTAEPEVQLHFDQFKGEPRNTDLLLIADDDHGRFIIAVEAKADESFSETVAETLSAALERKLKNARSNGIARIEQLAKAILGEHNEGELKIGDIRYQLLTATAGALAEGIRRKVERVVVLIHEFVTSKTTDSKHDCNASDLNSFVQRLSHKAISQISAQQLYGPIRVPGHPIFKEAPKLYIGKARRNLRRNIPVK